MSLCFYLLYIFLLYEVEIASRMEILPIFSAFYSYLYYLDYNLHSNWFFVYFKFFLSKFAATSFLFIFLLSNYFFYFKSFRLYTFIFVLYELSFVTNGFPWTYTLTLFPMRFKGSNFRISEIILLWMSRYCKFYNFMRLFNDPCRLLLERSRFSNMGNLGKLSKFLKSQ